MGKLKAKSPKNPKGSSIGKAKVSKLPSKIKKEQVREKKKLAEVAKFEIKKENIAPPVSPKQEKSKKRKNHEDSVAPKGTPKKQKSHQDLATKKTSSGKQKCHKGQISKKASSKKSKNEGKTKTIAGAKTPLQVTKISISNAEKAKLLAAEEERKHQQDLRTLYIRLKNKKIMKTESDILKIHPNIKHVRLFRARRHQTKRMLPIHFAFLEFESEKAALAAHKDLSPKSDDYFVDLMGPNSKTKKAPKSDNKKTGGKKMKEKSAAQINPLRLFINGISSGVSQSVLRELFPKAVKAVIPNILRKSDKLSKYGFLEFSNPIDAKAAFDASKDLEINGHHITVLYARYEMKNKSTDSTSSNQEKKAKSQNDDIKLESENDDKEEEDHDSESDVENDEDDSELDVEKEEEEEEEDEE